MGGWVKANDPEGNAWAKGDAKELADLAAYFPTGAILGKRGNKFQTHLTKAVAA